jgi:flavin reductase (DIM6/NTAB) family NADH-FMN oxidoreductase RutF
MAKIKIDTNGFLYPMPMTLVGALVDGKANFMAAAWVSPVNYRPPMVSIALGPHHTNQGVEANQAFSVNIPCEALMEKTDYCGLVSGKKTDKSKIFEVFYGSMPGAPLIAECPLNIACRVAQAVKLPFDTLYIGEVVEVFSEERYLTDGAPDIQKIKPFTLTMPDNRYWGLGAMLGKAWSVGKNLK